MPHIWRTGATNDDNNLGGLPVSQRADVLAQVAAMNSGSQRRGRGGAKKRGIKGVSLGGDGTTRRIEACIYDPRGTNYYSS